MRTLILSLAVAHAGGYPAAPTDASPAPSPVAASAAVVHIKNFAFGPDTLTIKPGDTVRFVQDDETAHTVTASDKSFDSGNLDRRATWSHMFATAGSYAYVCSYHPYMKGTIVVK